LSKFSRIKTHCYLYTTKSKDNLNKFKRFYDSENMKTKIAVISVAGTLVILLTLNIGLAFAAELNGTTGGSLNALNSGYAIARWPWDSGDVFPGETATVRACTTEPPYPEATQVVFRWIRSDGTYFDVGPKPLTLSGDTWNGDPIYDAYDTQTIDMVGNWGVQALFQNGDGSLQGPNDDYETVQIRAISYHATPEIPLGTIAAALTMIGALGIFFIFKRKTPTPQTH
jgi:hypothetical protein